MERTLASELDRAYDHCQRVAKEHAKNFYFAFRALPIVKRRAIYAAYAYCRMCDDIADGDIPVERKRRMLAHVRQTLRTALSRGASTRALAPEFRALSHAASTFDIPSEYFYQILEGVESDLTKTRFANFGELREYCYKVASVVGLVCIEVFGYTDARAAEYAIDMGIAMQLTNILRDVREDAERERVYLPQDEMERFGYTERDLMEGVVNDSFRRLMKLQAERARRYYDRSRPLFDLLDADSRSCPRVLHAAYAAILRRIEEAGFDVLSQRIGLSASEKLVIAARLWIGGIAPSLPLVRRLR